MLQAFIETYGYAAVFAGALLEGETVLVLAGFAAHRGYLDLPLVIVVAFVGSFLGDQFYFFLGQRHGRNVLARFPSWQPRAMKVQNLLYRYHTPLILAIRFMYGLRTVGPVVIGMSHVPWPRFFILNLIGALVWAVTFGGAGFLFGSALASLLTDIRRYEELVLWFIAAAGIALWAFYRFFHRNKKAGG